MENCRDTLLCNQVTYYGDYELKVFPNPAKDVCTIVVPTAGTMKLYNSNGSLIQERYFSESREYIHHIPNWATGIYMVVFEGEEGILTEKLSIVD
jgi:peptidoglycan hydrolase-like amidase